MGSPRTHAVFAEKTGSCCALLRDAELPMPTQGRPGQRGEGCLQLSLVVLQARSGPGSSFPVGPASGEDFTAFPLAVLPQATATQRANP